MLHDRCLGQGAISSRSFLVMPQGKVDCPHIFGQVANRNAIDAGFGDCTDELEVDAARGFELARPAVMDTA